MSRVIFISMILWGLVWLSSACSDPDRDSNQTPARSSKVSPFPSPKARTNNLDDEDIKGILAGSTRQNRLTRLSGSGRSDSFELRLWVNIGLAGDERLLTVQLGKSRKQAFFYHLNHIHESPKTPRKEQLLTPKSGWDSVEKAIANQLANPRRLRLDPRFDLDKHEGLLYLEVVERGEYRMVYYGQHSEFDDAKRVKDLCGYLSEEFGMDIDCLGQRTILGPIE